VGDVVKRIGVDAGRAAGGTPAQWGLRREGIGRVGEDDPAPDGDVVLQVPEGDAIEVVVVFYTDLHGIVWIVKVKLYVPGDVKSVRKVRPGGISSVKDKVTVPRVGHSMRKKGPNAVINGVAGFPNPRPMAVRVAVFFLGRERREGQHAIIPRMCCLNSFSHRM
jgi:hypothetical protein